MPNYVRTALITMVFAFLLVFQVVQAVSDDTGAVPLDKTFSYAPETVPEFPPYYAGIAADASLYAVLADTMGALNAKDHEEARTKLKELVGRCSDQGITSHEALSTALIKQGRIRLDNNDVAGAMLLFDYAITISPNYPPAYFTKGWALLSQKKFKVLVAFDAFLEGFSRSTRDFWWTYVYLGNKSTSLLFTLAALFSLFGLFIAVRYTPLLAHDLSERFDKTESEGMIKFLALPISFILVLLALGYWWAVTIVLLAFWFYLNKREKTVAILFFLLLVFMPGIMTRYASLVQGGGNEMIWILDEVNKGKIEPGTEEFLKKAVINGTENNTVPMLALAKVYTERRDFKQAADIYEKLVNISPESPIYRNNLGNVYFFMGDIDKALQEYRAATKYGPDDPLPHFNLSQLYGEMLMFTERSSEDSKASSLAPDLVTMLRSKEGGTPLRMVFDENIPINVLWDIALETSPDSRALAGSLWSTTIKVMPLEGASYAGIGFIVLVIGLNALRRSRTVAHFCDKCGKVSCKKCQKPVYNKELCSQCHQIFVKLEGVEARERLKKTLEIREKETKQGMFIRISSLLLPGSGHFLMGRPMRGFIFSGIFIFNVKDIFFGQFLNMPYSSSINVIGPDTVLMAALLLIFYVVTQFDIYRITKK